MYYPLSFEITLEYDEREVEDLLELLENLGAVYRYVGGPLYYLFIPEEFNQAPFEQILLDCDSVTKVIHLSLGAVRNP